MSKKRIKGLTVEATSSNLDDNDYGVVDSSSNGTRKFKLSSLATWLFNKFLSWGAGVKIYDTLQAAIADYSKLSVGTIFETNGFYTSGDGGATRYVVSNSGTANGMDIVSLGGGKLAVAQLKGSAFTEQIGYVVSTSKNDVTPYIKRLLNLGIQNIKFYPTGSAPTKCYCIRNTLDLTKADFHNVGVHLEGARIGTSS